MSELTKEEQAEAEKIRMEHLAEINAEPGSREALEAKHGEVYDTKQLQENFDVLSFMAPYIVCSRKSDGATGSMQFQHDPRFYFNFVPDSTSNPVPAS